MIVGFAVFEGLLEDRTVGGITAVGLKDRDIVFIIGEAVGGAYGVGVGRVVGDVKIGENDGAIVFVTGASVVGVKVDEGVGSIVGGSVKVGEKDGAIVFVLGEGVGLRLFV